MPARVHLAPKDSLVAQFRKLVQFHGADLAFTDAAITEIARIALERGMGTRALRSVVQEVMEPILSAVLTSLPRRGSIFEHAPKFRFFRTIGMTGNLYQGTSRNRDRQFPNLQDMLRLLRIIEAPRDSEERFLASA